MKMHDGAMLGGLKSRKMPQRVYLIVFMINHKMELWLHAPLAMCNIKKSMFAFLADDEE